MHTVYHNSDECVANIFTFKLLILYCQSIENVTYSIRILKMFLKNMSFRHCYCTIFRFPLLCPFHAALFYSYVESKSWSVSFKLSHLYKNNINVIIKSAFFKIHLCIPEFKVKKLSSLVRRIEKNEKLAVNLLLLCHALA